MQKKIDIITSMIDKSLLEMEMNTYMQKKFATIVVSIAYLFVVGLFLSYNFGYTNEYFRYENIELLMIMYTCAMIFTIVSLLKSKVKLNKLKEKFNNDKFKI